MATYDAFISYSHANDKPVAAALQSAVQKLGKPWYHRRALRIYRDDTSQAATPALWDAIVRALGESRYLILLASPEAAASPWVNKEVEYWLTHKSADTMLIALTDGDLQWDNALGEFFSRESMPLPRVVRGRFAAEPKWVDLRAYRDGADKGDAKFTELAADFAAAVRGMPKEDLLSQEVRQQRRALTLAWSAAALLLFLVGIAGWQWRVAVNAEIAALEQKEIAQEQKEIAQEERDRATKALSAGTKTANSLISELAMEFRNRPGMPVDLVRSILERALRLQQELSEPGRDPLGLRYSEADAHMEIALTLLQLGDTTNAVIEAETARDILDDVAATYSAQVNERGCDGAAFASMPKAQCLELVKKMLDDTLKLETPMRLAMAYGVVGDVQRRVGRRDETVATYRKAVGLLDAVAAEFPDTANLRDFRAHFYGNLGQALIDAGDRLAGAEFLRKAQALLSMNVSKDSPFPSDDFYLAKSLEETGDGAVVAERHDEALAAYRKSAELTRTLVAANTKNTQLYEALWRRLNKFADTLVTTDKVAEAIEIRNEATSVIEQLAATDAGNTAWQRERSVAHDRLGNVHERNDDNIKAVAAYQAAFDIVEKLARSDPSNLVWQEDLAVSYFNLGSVALEDRRFEDSLAYHKKSLEIGERLNVADPGNVRWRTGMANTYERIGKALRALGRLTEAVEFHLKCLAIREELLAADPTSAERRGSLAIGLVQLALADNEPEERLASALKIFWQLQTEDKLGPREKYWMDAAEQILPTLPVK